MAALDTRTYTVHGQSAGYFYHAEMTGLAPDTAYSYRVGDGTAWSEWFSFRSARGAGVSTM